VFPEGGRAADGRAAHWAVLGAGCGLGGAPTGAAGASRVCLTSRLGQLRMATVGRIKGRVRVDQTAVDPGVRQCTLSQKTSSICCGEAAATG